MLVYNSENMHIPSDIKEDLSFRLDDLKTVPPHLLKDEAIKYITDGFLIVEQVVSKELIFKARNYIDRRYRDWLVVSKRQDDWRTHFCMEFGDLSEIEHAPILDLFLGSRFVIERVKMLIGEPSGVFYTQIAYRTPTHTKKGIRPEYLPGAEYHLDGQANGSGVRFPDHWTVMIGFALVDITTTNFGNFTVFKGSHTSIDWSDYAALKQSQSLPCLGEPTLICLKAGDVILCHVLLAHRGGRNTTTTTTTTVNADAGTGDTEINSNRNPFLNIPANTREMVFIRLRSDHVNYLSESRPHFLVQDPWWDYSELFKQSFVYHE